MTKVLIGIVLGLLIGSACRWFDVPVPSPPKLAGALLVVAMTLGYAGTDRFLQSRSQPAATSVANCGGPTGKPAAAQAARTEAH